jgi:hypothetical protein
LTGSQKVRSSILLFSTFAPINRGFGGRSPLKIAKASFALPSLGE